MTSVLALLATTFVYGGAAAHSRPVIDANTVLTGAVTRDGVPVPGADILLVAWPNDEVLDALAEGELVDAKIVARATATAAGDFAVSLDPAAVGQRHTQETGDVDIELVVADSAHEVSWHFTATRATPEQAEETGLAWTNPFINQSLITTRIAEQKASIHLSVDLARSTVVQEGDPSAEWVGAR